MAETTTTSLDADAAPTPAQTARPRQHPDARRQRLRGIMGALDRALGALSAGAAAPAHADLLRVIQRELVAELNLGPEPEVITCPSCGAIAMRGATRCMECWGKLTS
jgi:hypothetical protein